MTSATNQSIKVMRGENKGELMLCLADIRGEGCTYQMINNKRLIKMFLAATGNMLPGQVVDVSVSVKK